MGNRCIITDKAGKVGVYLHWNGGRDSVEGFLEYCKRKGCRGFGSDSSYAIARLVQVVANFFGGTSSIGITTGMDCDDNGVYVVDGWNIVGRYYWKYNPETEEYDKTDFPEEWEQREYPLEEMLEGIDGKQPESEQLGDFLKATKAPVSSIKIGDTVFVENWDGQLESHIVVGFGKDEVVNGRNVKGLPLIDKYNGGSRGNPNNYVYTEEVWKA